MNLGVTLCLAARVAPVRMGYSAGSAVPGTSVVESQPSLTPLDHRSHVLVVGATRGLGFEFTRALLERGCTVVATHRSVDPPPALSDLSTNADGRLTFVQLDVADEDSVARAAATLSARGTAPLSHLIHSAGVYGPKGSLDGAARHGRPAAPPVRKADMLSTYAANAVGPLLVAQHFVPLMGPTDGYVDVPILAILSSKVGSVDDNGSGGAYAYPKAAVNIIAKSLHCDLRPDGRATVLLLYPGYVRTDMTGGAGLIDVDESVGGMIRAIEATDADTDFRWVDYKACRIPW